MFPQIRGSSMTSKSTTPRRPHINSQRSDRHSNLSRNAAPPSCASNWATSRLPRHRGCAILPSLWHLRNVSRVFPGKIGDIPIYVALDSADVWANPKEFRLLPNGRPDVVSGVPPDLFTKDGQLWGNPVFDWQAMEEDGFVWWIDRVRRLTELVDVVRIDHFRGLAAGWVVPAGDATARGGRW